jgi:CheY-like chemotaxis protein
MLAMSNQPDVVLMDINLEGGREGIEVARIRSGYSKATGPPAPRHCPIKAAARMP